MKLDADYLHLALNHFPIILSILALGACIAALIVRRRAAWLYAVATITFAGLTIYPTYLTGDRAEHEVEELWYVSGDAIEEHEEAGKFALWVVLVSGAVGAFAWWRMVRGADREGTPPAWLRAVVTVAALASVTTLARTALLGGEIIHEADRLETAPPGVQAPATSR